MKVVIQRCNTGSVKVKNEIRKIDKGYVVLLGMTNGDTEKEIDYLIKKISNLRIFEDDNNKMNYSIQDINGSILLVSQFTLYANTKDGNRPSFIDSMKYDEALKLYNLFVDKLKGTNIPIKTGEFGEDMVVNIENDGPVTIIIDTKENLYEK
ncbi:MAG: D-tyrosyl-tRNA(Tyr) deacylase [Bacilli bacterium]|nr:D-tyrosyl-tRNA(Tyr) deacylase [Bacilli bacterium]